MKITYIFSILFLNILFFTGARAQVTIGMSDAADASALVDLRSQADKTSTKGLLLPRFTVTNVNTFGLAGAAPTEGMAVYSPANAGNTGAGIYVWNGTRWQKSQTPADLPLPVNVVPTDIGSVIVVNGKLVTAQVISATMGANYSYSAPLNTATAIGNISTIIVDNKSTFVNTPTSNQFTVASDGTYTITMNVQITAAAVSVPTIGVYDNNTSTWVTSMNDNYTVINAPKVMTLIMTIPLVASKTYSFRFNSNVATTISAVTTDAAGTGSVSYYSIQQVK